MQAKSKTVKGETEKRSMKKKRNKPKTRLSVRYAKKSEMEAVWALEKENLRFNWDIHPTTTRPLNDAELDAHHRNTVRFWFDAQAQKLLVAAYGERLVGLCWYSVAKDALFKTPMVTIYSIIVHPEHRRKGIAKRLVNEVKRRGKRQGALFVRLSVLHKNHAAMNLYRSLGFFDESHGMLARLEPTAPERRKAEAKKRKGKKG